MGFGKHQNEESKWGARTLFGIRDYSLKVAFVIWLLWQISHQIQDYCSTPHSRFLTNIAEVFTSYEVTENMFNFFYKIIIFRLNKERGIRSAYIY